MIPCSAIIIEADVQSQRIVIGLVPSDKSISHAALYDFIQDELSHGYESLEIDLTDLPIIQSGLVGFLVNLQKGIGNAGGSMYLRVEKDSQLNKELRLMKLEKILNLKYSE